MHTSFTHLQHDLYVAYTCDGSPWQVLIKRDGNHAHYEAAFRLERDGDALFTLFPRAATRDETALLHLRLPLQALADAGLQGAAISVHSHIPAVVHIEPAAHRILVEFRCVLATCTQPPALLVMPEPEVALRFLHPEVA